MLSFLGHENVPVRCTAVAAAILLVMLVARLATPWPASAAALPALGAGLVFWAVGVFVLLHRANDPIAARFCHFGLVVALALALGPLAASGPGWVSVIAATTASFAPAMLLDFGLWFALGAPPRWAAATALAAYLLAGLLVVAAFVAGLGGSGHPVLLDGPRRACALVCASATLVLLLRTAFRSPQPEPQARLVLVGVALAVLPFASLVLVPLAMGDPSLLRPDQAAAAVALLPLVIAYAILRTGLWGIDIVLRRGLVDAAMTLALAAGYAIVLGAIAGDGPSARLSWPLLGFFALVAVSFVPVRDGVRRLVNRVLYHERADGPRALQDMARLLTIPQPVDDLCGEVAAGLLAALGLRGVAVLLPRSGGELAVRGAAGDGELASRLAAAPVAEAGATGTPCGSLGGCLPLPVPARPPGRLCLGPKRARVELTRADTYLAEAAAQHLGLAVAYALAAEQLVTGGEELEHLRDQLLRAREEEQRRVAEALHDDPLRAALDVAREARAVAARLPAPADPRLRDHLDRLLGHAADLSEELRDLVVSVYPFELPDLGLAAALEALVERVAREELVLIHLAVQGLPEDTRLARQVEEGLYRTARETVTNACRHARASRIDVELTAAGGEARLVVRDDGRGFVPSPESALVRAGHLGLASVRRRLEQQGGSLAVTSAPGSGTVVTARIPLEPPADE